MHTFTFEIWIFASRLRFARCNLLNRYVNQLAAVLCVIRAKPELTVIAVVLLHEKNAGRRQKRKREKERGGEERVWERPVIKKIPTQASEPFLAWDFSVCFHLSVASSFSGFNSSPFFAASYYMYFGTATVFRMHSAQCTHIPFAASILAENFRVIATECSFNRRESAQRTHTQHHAPVSIPSIHLLLALTMQRPTQEQPVCVCARGDLLS